MFLEDGDHNVNVGFEHKAMPIMHIWNTEGA